MDERQRRNATTQQLVNQIIGLSFSLLGLYLAKKMMQPNFGASFRMRGALLVKKVAQNQADAWQVVATNAANSYQKARL